MLYRRIDYNPDLEDGFGENVLFVGVHAVKWHDRPFHPAVAFVESDDPVVEAASVTQDALQDLFDGCVHANNREELSEYVDGSLLDAANAALRLGKSKGMEKYG